MYAALGWDKFYVCCANSSGLTRYRKLESLGEARSREMAAHSIRKSVYACTAVFPHV